MQLQEIPFFSEIRNLEFDCSNCSQNFSNGLITGTPQFIDQDNGDFHLTAGSPAIDMGSEFQFELLYSNNGYQPFWDYDYQEDPDDTEPDIGAFYYPQLSGTMESDITLSGEASLSSNTTVPIGVTLTIDEGTQIDVAQDAQLTVNGELLVNGSEGNEVIFQPSEIGGTWHGIKIDGGTVSLNNTQISYTSCGVSMLPGSSGNITSCEITNSYTGIKVESDNVSIYNSSIHENSNGIASIGSNPEISHNEIFNNQYDGIFLVGSNPSLSHNAIHDNGNSSSDVVINGGILSVGSAPRLTLVIDPEMHHQTNNLIYNNHPTGIFVTFSGLPLLGEYYVGNAHPAIFGGFNQFYGNDVFAIYRDQMMGTPNDIVMMAQANYWHEDLYNLNAPTGTSVYGNISIEPTAPSLWGQEIDPNPIDGPSENLVNGIKSEEIGLYTEAIDAYNLALEEHLDKYYVQIALNGLDRCYAKLILVDPWIARLEQIAQDFPSQDEKELAKNYLIWEYKKQKLDAEAIALSEELIALASDNPELEAYYTMVMAMLIEDTDGEILLRETPEVVEMKNKVRQAEERLLTEFAESEPAQLYSLLFNKQRSENKTAIVPDEFALYPAYPNPFNPITNIKYDIPLDSRVTIMIYDILGRAVTKLVENKLNAPGNHRVQWNGVNSSGKPVSSGMYFYQIKAKSLDDSKTFISTEKMILLK